MSTTALLATTTVLTIGRKRTAHSPRILIEDGRVIVRTRCGLDPTDEGFTETHGFITCETCRAMWEATR